MAAAPAEPARPGLRDRCVHVPPELRGTRPRDAEPRDGVLLSFITTTTVFGTPVDITLFELALETFFPADEHTAAALRA